MRAFDTMNPAAVLVHLLLTAGIAMFASDPVLPAVSLAAALLYDLQRNGLRQMRFHALVFGLAAVYTLLNPLWNQRGETVLFFVNQRAFTAEALCYGAVTGLRLAAVMCWCRLLSELMTSEKLFYLLRFLSPELALVFSMSVRHLTLFRRQWHRIRETQRAMGLYRDDGLVGDVYGGLRAFSVLLSWALENGIITANSMAARGYGSGRRSSYSIYRWQRGDVLLLGLSLVTAGAVIAGLLCGCLDWQYYPKINAPAAAADSLAVTICYAILACLPVIYEGRERWKWHCLRSSI